MTEHDYTFRFFFDFGETSCLWAADQQTRAHFGYPVALEELPVSPDLVNVLRALATEFDASINWNNPAGPSPWSSNDAATFFEKADLALVRLRQELGPRVHVVAEHRPVDGQSA